MQTGIIILWITILCVIVYLVLCVRYHYRISDGVTLLQCEHDTFDTSMLHERMPLVCSGFQNTDVFKKLQHESFPEKDIYANLRHIQPWLSTPQPITTETPSTQKNEFQQCRDDVCLLIQKDGASSVWLVHPNDKVDPLNINATVENETANTKTKNQDKPNENFSYTEVILRKGTGLFIPFQWWFAIHNNDKDVRTNVMADPSQLHKLGWKSVLLSMM